jgi:CBS domain-containing protein
VIAKDIMTAPVVSVAPQATIGEVAKLLLERRVSGLPVVEGGRLVGIVSEGDLMRRHEIGTDRKADKAAWWQRVLGLGPGPAEYVKSHAERVEDIMSRDVVSIPEDTPVTRIAALFGKRSIKRLPVLRGERLVGIVTQADLVRAIAARASMWKGPEGASDRTIRARLLDELGAQAWWRAESSVVVQGGIVHFWGVCKNEDERRAARVAAENVPGVQRVDDHRAYYIDLAVMG